MLVRVMPPENSSPSSGRNGAPTSSSVTAAVEMPSDIAKSAYAARYSDHMTSVAKTYRGRVSARWVT
jgi:hypothetical protein